MIISDGFGDDIVSREGFNIGCGFGVNNPARAGEWGSAAADCSF